RRGRPRSGVARSRSATSVLGFGLGDRFFGRGGFLDRGFGGGFFGRSLLADGLFFNGRRVGGGFGQGGGAGGFALGLLGGAFFGLLARLALVRVVAVRPFGQALGGQEAGDAVGRLGALGDPV